MLHHLELDVFTHRMLVLHLESLQLFVLLHDSLPDPHHLIPLGESVLGGDNVFEASEPVDGERML